MTSYRYQKQQQQKSRNQKKKKKKKLQKHYAKEDRKSVVLGRMLWRRAMFKSHSILHNTFTILVILPGPSLLVNALVCNTKRFVYLAWKSMSNPIRVY